MVVGVGSITVGTKILPYSEIDSHFLKGLR